MDRVILVNSRDRKIGEMDKITAHEGEGRLHRAISVFLFNRKGRLLIQRRAKEKIVGALQWANTCCGNVRPGETRRQCALRRLKEELGIEGVSLKHLTMFTYQAKCNESYSEHELDGVYVGRFEGKVEPNINEAIDTRWVEVGTLPDLEYAPWFELMCKEGIVKLALESGRKNV